jgi:hypothetical protein
MFRYDEIQIHVKKHNEGYFQTNQIYLLPSNIKISTIKYHEKNTKIGYILTIYTIVTLGRRRAILFLTVTNTM